MHSNQKCARQRMKKKNDDSSCIQCCNFFQKVHHSKTSKQQLLSFLSTSFMMLFRVCAMQLASQKILSATANVCCCTESKQLSTHFDTSQMTNALDSHCHNFKFDSYNQKTLLLLSELQLVPFDQLFVLNNWRWQWSISANTLFWSSSQKVHWITQHICSILLNIAWVKTIIFCHRLCAPMPVTQFFECFLLHTLDDFSFGEWFTSSLHHSRCENTNSTLFLFFREVILHGGHQHLFHFIGCLALNRKQQTNALMEWQWQETKHNASESKFHFILSTSAMQEQNVFVKTAETSCDAQMHHFVCACISARQKTHQLLPQQGKSTNKIQADGMINPNNAVFWNQKRMARTIARRNFLPAISVFTEKTHFSHPGLICFPILFDFWQKQMLKILQNTGSWLPIRNDWWGQFLGLLHCFLCGRRTECQCTFDWWVSPALSSASNWWWSHHQKNHTS